MNYRAQNGITISEGFARFHEANPKVYHYFKHFFYYLHDRKGWRKVSGKLIVERLRWEWMIRTNDPDFKISNNFTSHYVRLFISDFPQYKSCFELRTIKSE